MARGRFLNKEICIDRKVNELSCYESILAFTWIIPHLDCNGLTYGDPAVVRSMIFPRRNDITVEQMESYIKEWVKKGLIKVYEKGDEKYIWFPNFDKHQIGLNKTREAKSGIPLPDDFPIEECEEENPEESRKDAGKNPETIRNNVKLSKGNGNSNVNGNENDEVEINESDDNPLITTFTQHTHLKPGTEAEEIELDLIEAGVIESDIVNAINFLTNNQNMKCTSFKSVRNSAIIEMQRRTGSKKKIDIEDPRRYLKGEYGEFGSH